MPEPEDLPNRPAALAAAAASARSLVGYSIEGAADALGLTAAVLSEIEAGVLPIGEELQRTMEWRYGMTFDALVAEMPGNSPRTPIDYNAAEGVLRVGDFSIRWNIGLDSNDDLLRDFASAVRRQRRTPPSVPVRLRSADLPVLATLLDLDDPELDRRAQFWFGQTPETRQSFAMTLRLSVPRNREALRRDRALATLG